MKHDLISGVGAVCALVVVFVMISRSGSTQTQVTALIRCDTILAPFGLVSYSAFFWEIF